MKREAWQNGTARITRAAKMARRLEPSPSPASEGPELAGKWWKSRPKTLRHHPVAKSKDKAKGMIKLRACDVALNHRLVSWRVVGDGGVRSYAGLSATAFLKNLQSNSWHEEDDEDDGGGETWIGYGELAIKDADDVDRGVGEEEEEEDNEAMGDALIDAAGEERGEMEATDDGDGDGDGDGDEMEFCVVGIVWEFSDQEEDWVVLEEI